MGSLLHYAPLALGLILPFAGTVLGSLVAFPIKGEMPNRAQKALLGFASGVMVAASVWSLLIPAIEQSEEAGAAGWLPATIGFLAGIGFLLVLDKVVPHQHLDNDEPEGPKSAWKKRTKLVLAVTLHNIPEGMAVGVVLAGLLAGEASITFAGALALSLGIAIQNIPEGAVIAAPLRASGASRTKAFGLGVLSGVVEPLGALVAVVLAAQVLPLLPYFLSFAAGAMIYVVVEELIPETAKGRHSNLGVMGFALGFAAMMVLDVALG